MADDLFNDFDDLGSFENLDEAPSFDFGEEESLPEFGEPGEEPGISRTFRIVGALMALAVVLVVVLLVLFVVSRSGELTANEKTSTAVIRTNTAIAFDSGQTLTAIFQMERATQTAVQDSVNTVTAQALTVQAQQTIDAANAASTATAAFNASQTAIALAATQDFFNTQTATIEAGKLRLIGQVIGEDGVAVANATVRLYKDDGDGQFTPADRPVSPGGSPGGEGGPAPGGTVLGEPQPIAYGEIKEGTLATGEVAEWTFTGVANDSVLINALASDPVQMDMFLQLVDANGNMVTSDDDSGEASNAAITNFALPASGEYTIRVSSATGPGAYTLMLSLGLTIPPAAPVETPTPTQEATPEGGAEEEALPEPTGTSETAPGARLVPSGNNGIVLAHAANDQPVALAQEGDTPTPPPPSGDELIDVITSATDGTFDFGSLEAGTYWVEVEYASLPPDLQALVPFGQPLVIQVNVPVEGEITFDIMQFIPPPPGISPTPSPTRVVTGTPVPTGFVATVAPTVEPAGTIASPVALPTSGFFSDIGDKTGNLDGTSGLTVLAIAGAGLVAVVFIARKLRTSA